MRTGPHYDRRAWAEVDLGIVQSNVIALQQYVSNRNPIMAVVKANAYGHGMAQIAGTALEAGAASLGVATMSEAIELRQVFPQAQICIFSPILPDESSLVSEYEIEPFVSDLAMASNLSIGAGRPVKVHIEIDTGMGRAGFLPAQAVEMARKIRQMPNLQIAGLCTHFARADSDLEFTARQQSMFVSLAEHVQKLVTKPMEIHFSNSPALMNCPLLDGATVRPGLLLYGIKPASLSDAKAPDVRPALSLKSRVALVRCLDAGSSIGYGNTCTLQRTTLVATVPIGYGDGYPRELSTKGHVLIRGRHAPILGRVCMDAIMLDVTEIPEVTIGDPVTLIGRQGDEQIRVEDIADCIGTTEHDITTRLLPRLPRYYSI